MSELGIFADETQINSLVEYIRMLEKWNKAYNLTAVRQANEMVIRHILDSLSIAHFVHGKNIADLGTGAGLPGIPLSIMLSGKRFTLIDSSNKKTIFLTNACRQLGLKDVSVAQSRLENYQPTILFDTLVTRALANVAEVLRLAGHLVKPGGEVLLMKSRGAESELVEPVPGFVVEDIEQLSVPGLAADRKLVQIRKLDS